MNLARPRRRATPHGLLATINELARLEVAEVDGSGRSLLLYRGEEPAALQHLTGDADRLDRFLNLMPDNLKDLRVLELGANPYILTYALARRGVSVVANGLPRGDGVSASATESVRFADPRAQTVLELPLVRFNVESDPFPFADESFDVVICGEIIEHLPHGPHGMLFESNRVLRSGGRLLLSTPNSVSLARLIAIFRGTNPDWPFSDQGLFGRHNRNYTLQELEDLLRGNGFEPLVEEGITFFHNRSWYAPGPLGAAKWLAMITVQRVLSAHSVRLRRWAEGLLVTGTKVGDPRLYRPAWLYGSADTIPMIARNKSGEESH